LYNPFARLQAISFDPNAPALIFCAEPRSFTLTNGATMEQPFENLSKEDLIALLQSLGKNRTPDLAVAKIVDAYLSHLKIRVEAKDFCAEAFDTHVRILGFFKAMFGPQTVGACRQHDLTEFMKSKPTWKSPWTKNYAATCILCCMNWAKDEGLIEKTPYKRPKLLGRMRPRRPWEVFEYVLMMRNGNRALRRILYFLRRTGARTCEARELQWEDCNLYADAPCIVLAEHKTARVTGEARTIGLDPSTVSFLKNLQRQAPPNMTHVFLNYAGKPWSRSALGQTLHRLVSRLGLSTPDIKLTAYGLRHMFCVHAIESGMSARKMANGFFWREQPADRTGN
jgi:site-specific recombinase XerC